MKNKILFFFIFTILFITNANAQSMADQFRADGKIYVVIAVAAVILSGIAVYLFLLDRKISKIEDELKNKN